MTKKGEISWGLQKVIIMLIILIIILVTATLAKESLTNADIQTTNIITKNTAISYCTQICLTCFQDNCLCELPKDKQYTDENGKTIETLSCSDLGAEYTTPRSDSSENTELISGDTPSEEQSADETITESSTDE
ncbi:hypothetical protein GQ473_05715 [archaeon]|nr:hypothetical protein [archaeon]